MNRTIKDATVKKYHYDTVQQLKQHLYDFINAYNYSKPLKALKFKTPIEFMIKIYHTNSKIFYKNPYHDLMGLNT